jgi:AcrR family transcriptional regulator
VHGLTAVPVRKGLIFLAAGEVKSPTHNPLFAKVGYDAVTMTAVAERANTSIGALYRWFPDKAALGSALMVRYSQGIEERWAPILAAAGRVPTPEFAAMMIETMMGFFRERPAFFVLREAPINVTGRPPHGRTCERHLPEPFDPESRNCLSIALT